MAKKEKEFNYQTATTGELEARLGKTRDDLFKIRFRAVSAPVKNTMQIRGLRREIARINTFINQKKTVAPSGLVENTKRGNGRAKS